MKRPKGPYAILCVAGCQERQGRPVQQFLTIEEYEYQMGHEDREWVCPVCFTPGAFWDDENEQNYYDYVDANCL